MRVSIKYGVDRIPLQVPEDCFAGRWGMESASGADTAMHDGDAPAVRRAVNELGAAGFASAIAGRTVGLLLADGTRKWSPEELVPPLFATLRGARRVIAFLATGTHDTESPENLRLARRVLEVLDPALPAVELEVNDCRKSPHRPLGITSRGTRVEVHERAGDCDAFLTLADMKNHYFAGYSNAVKYLVPGIASLESIRGNHSLALEEASRFGRHPWHPDPSRRTNPLAEDLLEAFELVVGDRPHFALALVTTDRGILWAGGGTTEEVTRRGIEVVDRTAGLVLEPQRFLVVSPGGQPHDESLYTAQRALELSSAALRPGGEVLLLARCGNGIGPPGAREHFYEPLTRPLGEIAVTDRSEYRLYGHKPVKFARYIEGLAAVHMHSVLPADEVRRIHMLPAPDPQALLDRWVEAAGPGDRVAFLDDASKLAIHAPSRGPDRP